MSICSTAAPDPKKKLIGKRRGGGPPAKEDPEEVVDPEDAIEDQPKPKERGTPRILDAKWDGKSVFDVADAAEIFEISPWAVYEAIKSGELGAVKIGRLLKIPRHVIERKLAV